MAAVVDLAGVTIVRGGATLINDCYNANPTSMRAALELLRDLDSPGRRIVVDYLLPCYLLMAALSASTRSVRSQVKSSPVRPKWPFRAVWA